MNSKYIFLIIIIFVSAAIETDIFLPALTDIMAFFSISEERVQSLLTWNFVGICASGPLYGPLSDAFGRKKPLMVALGIFLAGSLFTLIAPEFNLMLLGRILQGLGSGGCFTLGTAIIFDVFNEKQAVQAINKMNSIVPFIMASAPMLGGYLNHAYGFRSNFLAIAIFVLSSFIITGLFFDETLAKEKRVPFQPRKILADFKRVFVCIPFWQTVAVVSLLFSGYLAFLSGISVLFVMELGVDKQALPLYQGAMLGAWLVGSLTCKQSIERLGTPKVKWIGTTLSVVGGLTLAFACWAAPQSPPLLTSGVMLYAFGANWIQGLYFPEGMGIFPDIKGVTASILTSTRLLITACVIGLSSTLYDGTIYPIAAVVCGVIIVTTGIIILYERKRMFSKNDADAITP